MNAELWKVRRAKESSDNLKMKTGITFNSLFVVLRRDKKIPPFFFFGIQIT